MDCIEGYCLPLECCIAVDNFQCGDYVCKGVKR